MTAEISQFSQDKLISEINLEYAKLASLLEENPPAYKKLWEVHQKVIEFSDNARLLQIKPKELITI